MKTSLDIYNEFMEMAPEIANDWAQVQREIGCPEDVITHDEYWGDCFKAYAIKHYDWAIGDDIIRFYFNGWRPEEQRVPDICYDDYDLNEYELKEVCFFEIKPESHMYSRQIINRAYYPHYNINERAKYLDWAHAEQCYKTAFIKAQHESLPF